ncbi:hypothetical protein [Mesorhizobium sp. M1163]|uniref:hypothetical protein n=1 Tax=Mesorhizobium sp. M1163 TaxID=2957065 RepID=UPI00333A3BBB
MELARRWAEEAPDVEVDGGFSAVHWAGRSQYWATRPEVVTVSMNIAAVLAASDNMAAIIAAPAQATAAATSAGNALTYRNQTSGYRDEVASIAVTFGDLASAMTAINAARDLAQAYAVSPTDVGPGSPSAKTSADLAAAKAAAALVSETNAGVSAGQALAAAGGIIYDTTTAGIAATVNGQFFIVKGDGTTTYALMYKNVATVATLVASYPSKTALDNALLLLAQTLLRADGPTEFSLTDQDGYRWLRVTPTVFQHPVIDSIRVDLAIAKAVTDRSKQKSGPTEFSLTDQDGYRWMRLSPTVFQHQVMDSVRSDLAAAKAVTDQNKQKSGPAEWSLTDVDGSKFFEVKPATMRHPVIDRFARRIDRNERPLPDPAYALMATLAERIGLHMLGESLSMGHLSNPPISTTPSTRADMFNGGVRPEDRNDTDFSGNRASLTSAFEVTKAPGIDDFVTDGGETPMSGMVEMIAQLLVEEDGYDPLALGQKFLLAADGHNGQPISGMLQGSVASDVYERVLASIGQGASLYEAAGKSYVPGALTIFEGANDNFSDVTYQYYLDNLRLVRSQFQAPVDAILGWHRPLPMAVIQTCTHPTNGLPVPNVALASLAVCADAEMVFAGPAYPFPQISVGDLHLSARGSKWAGAYFGLVLKRLLFDQIKVAPLVPVIHAQGNNIIARFPVDRGRRIIGGATSPEVPAVTNWGLAAVSAAGATKTLSNPRIAGRDCIVWDASETPADAWKFRFAWTGDAYKGYSNIRDDNPLIFDRSFLKLPMQKWVPICEVILT